MFATQPAHFARVTNRLDKVTACRGWQESGIRSQGCLHICGDIDCPVQINVAKNADTALLADVNKLLIRVAVMC